MTYALDANVRALAETFGRAQGETDDRVAVANAKADAALLAAQQAESAAQADADRAEEAVTEARTIVNNVGAQAGELASLVAGDVIARAEQSETAAREAAQTALTQAGAAVTAADLAEGAAAQVSADADRAAAEADRAAAAAASVPQNATEYAIQIAPALPPRPASKVVHWLTWSNPTALMHPYDLWFQQPEPTVPDMPADASWAFDNARTGNSAILRIFGVPQFSPPLTAVEYRIDGSAWAAIPAEPGEHEIAGLVDGSTAVADLRYVNFLGGGIPATRTATISDDPFSDNFDRADGNLSSDARWLDVATGGVRRVAIASGALRPTGINETVAAQVREYFRADQQVAATVIATGTNTSSARGVFLYVRMQPGINSGYRLRLAGGSMWIERVINGTGTSLVGGTRPGTLPVQAELRVVGRTLTASISGVAVLTVTDNDPAAFLSGTVGVGFNAAGADTISGTRIDNFTAGNA